MMYRYIRVCTQKQYSRDMTNLKIDFRLAYHTARTVTDRRYQINLSRAAAGDDEFQKEMKQKLSIERHATGELNTRAIYII